MTEPVGTAAEVEGGLGGTRLTLRPRLKQFATRREPDGRLVLGRDAGIELTLEDSTGEIERLLRLLDGTRTTAEVAGDLGVDPAAVAATVACLDAERLLEDADAPNPLTAAEQQRY